jgi:hypothetical protein
MEEENNMAQIDLDAVRKRVDCPFCEPNEDEISKKACPKCVNFKWCEKHRFCSGIFEVLLTEVEKLRTQALPEPEPETDYNGLKLKYRVYKARNNEPVEGCFVLRPQKDPAARAALQAYAEATDNEQLAFDLKQELRQLETTAATALFRELDKSLFDERKCRVCGCTDSHACPSGCYWVEEDLCSACAEKEGPA